MIVTLIKQRQTVIKIILECMTNKDVATRFQHYRLLHNTVAVLYYIKRLCTIVIANVSVSLCIRLDFHKDI
jgi:hypothetical protein